MEVSAKQFNALLFRWYRTHGRHDLPWRKTADPYHILVSEVMLQQTQVSRALTKYAEFLTRFPDVATLAAAPLGAVLRAWSGLGYNRRARYLRDCAKAIVARGGVRPFDAAQGKPPTFSELLELPGVGPSTAAAISSFSFGADEPMIDTNIRRIICRVFFPHKTPSDEKLYAFAKTLIPKKHGKEWNWAMMDVGALLCKAKGHDNRCPFQKLHGPVTDFVYKKPQKKFAGSDRYYRGRILAALAAKQRGISSSTLRDTLHLSNEKFVPLIAGLRREKLIKKLGVKLALP